MIGGCWILGGVDGRTPIKAKDVLEWGRFFEKLEIRRVALTDLPTGGFVSTVFLGIDHRFGPGRPLLFETMSFIGGDADTEGDWDNHQDRYCTWSEAEAGHARICAQIFEALEQAAAGMSAALVPSPGADR